MTELDATLALLVDVAESLDAALTVPHSPMQQAMRDAMDAAPQVGDMVVVTMARASTPAIERVGRYLGIEPVTDEDGEEIDEAFAIVVADGRVMYWTNAAIVRVEAIEDAARAMLAIGRGDDDLARRLGYRLAGLTLGLADPT